MGVLDKLKNALFEVEYVEENKPDVEDTIEDAQEAADESPIQIEYDINVEVKENDNTNADKEEDKHKYWKDILSRLYRIQDTFSKEPNDKEGKKEIYSESLRR